MSGKNKNGAKTSSIYGENFALALLAEVADERMHVVQSTHLDP